jgi:DNA-binding transcriptional regulator LsrR (DeoR family)
MSTDPSSDKDDDALAVAQLRAQGHSQKDIARRLDVAEAEVSRLKKRAKQMGALVDICVLSDSIRGDAEKMRRIKARIAPGELTETLKTLAIRNARKVFPDVRVFPNEEEGTSDREWERRLVAFSRAAAGYVRDLVLGSKGITGVSWGNAAAETVKALGDIPVPPKHGREIQFLPLCGEPLEGSPTRFSSSSLAAQLDHIFNRRLDHSLSLPVPAFIPKDFTTREVAVVRRLLGRFGGYSKVFGGNGSASHNGEPLINQIDTILTSVGHPDITFRFGPDDQFLKSLGFKREEVSSILIGDIGGVPLPRPHLDASRRSVLHEIRQRWTGIREEHLRACAEKASGSCGTIVVAIGANKAETVCECVRRGLVNHLVIDQELADELESLANPLTIGTGVTANWKPPRSEDPTGQSV